MPASLPYLPSNKNVAELFTKIASAAIPPKFTQEFLQTTIGLKGTNDRPLIPLLRNLGFLDQSNTPTPAYSLLKSKDKNRAAIAAGIISAYAPLFAADETANEQQGEKLKSLVAQVAGTDDDMTARIASTFTSLVKQGDFKAKLAATTIDEKAEDVGAADSIEIVGNSAKGKGLRPEFQYVIQVQLPLMEAKKLISTSSTLYVRHSNEFRGEGRIVFDARSNSREDCRTTRRGRAERDIVAIARI